MEIPQASSALFDFSELMHTYSSTLLLCVIASLLLQFVFLRMDPLDKVPGPSFVRWNSLYRPYLNLRGNGPEKLCSLHEKYGSVVRIGPTHVSISDVAAMNQLYGVGHRFKKSGFYDIFSPLHAGKPLDTLFSTRDPALHRRLRLGIASRFSTSGVRQFEPTIDRAIAKFIRKARTLESKRLSVPQWIEYFTFDLTAEKMFDESLGFVETGHDIDGIIGGLPPGFFYGATIGQLPRLHPWLLGSRAFLTTLSILGLPNPTSRIIDIVKAKSESWRLGGKPKNAGLVAWLEADERETALKLTDDEILSHVFNFLAGSGTIANALIVILYNLVQNPSAYHTLVKEIDKYYLDNPGSEKHLSWDVQNLPYLQAVIKESLRIVSPVDILLERITPEEGCTMLGYYLPPGTTIGAAARVMHHNREIFDAPAQFSPERWMDGNTTHKKLQRMEKAFLAFGRGSRGCIGKPLAMLSMSKFLVTLLRHFEVKWASDAPRWEVKHYFMLRAKGFFVEFKAQTRGKTEDSVYQER